MYLSN